MTPHPPLSIEDYVFAWQGLKWQRDMTPHPPLSMEDYVAVWQGFKWQCDMTSEPLYSFEYCAFAFSFRTLNGSMT